MNPAATHWRNGHGIGLDQISARTVLSNSRFLQKIITTVVHGINAPLILMDVQMPRMNGLDATRAIRLLPAHAQTPIVACTGNAFTEVRVRCMEAGMTDFVTKPTLPDVLYAAIFKALESGQIQ